MDDVDRIIFVESENDLEKELLGWRMDKKGSGNSVQCYILQNTGAGGICQTESSHYPWGFCSRSCSARTENFGTGHYGLQDGLMQLERLDGIYYDAPQAGVKLQAFNTGKKGFQSES